MFDPLLKTNQTGVYDTNTEIRRYHTPVSQYANMTSLASLKAANVTITAPPPPGVVPYRALTLENKSDVPAVFIRLHLVDNAGNPILPVKWSENYITLWPGEKLDVTVEYAGATGTKGATVVFDGRNVEEGSVRLV
jgi:exo-1,4-beta-D-glucosaminidase